MSTKCFRALFYCFIALYILFSASFSSSLLLFYPFLWPPHSQFSQEILSFSPSYLDPCVSLLGSSLLSRLSGVVNVGWFFFTLYLEATYEWVHCLSGSGLPHSIWFFFSRSIHLPANFKMSLFFTVCSTLCKCTTFSLSILRLRGI